jgi:hypothetical protein
VKVDLPSGATAEVRTALKAKDKFAVQGAVRVANDGGVEGSVMSLLETVLMARILETWSLDAPLPGAHACQECTGDRARWQQHVRDEFGEALDLDDFNELEKVISPLLSKVMQAPNLET